MIIQLLPPGGGGLRDFAEGLGHAWRDRDIDCRVLDARQDDPVRLSTQLRPLASDPPLRLVVHFSGYGYARRGLCQWLIDELRTARATWRDADRMVVVFHELFASGWPWQSAFWLSPVQRHIAVQLAGLADKLWTNTELHGRWLRRQRPDAALTVMPVFSNVGEPGPGPDWPSRERRAVVFGSQGSRQRALAALRGRESVLRDWGVEELVHVGSGAEIHVPLGIRQRHLGRLDGTALTGQLQAARYGLLDYPAEALGKSGVFAAYAVHGCVSINTRGRDRPADGLQEGMHYLDLRASARPLDPDMAAMAATTQDWYRPHGRVAQALALLAQFT